MSLTVPDLPSWTPPITLHFAPSLRLRVDLAVIACAEARESAGAGQRTDGCTRRIQRVLPDRHDREAREAQALGQRAIASRRQSLASDR